MNTSAEIDITICEVGLRDGLQNAKDVMITAAKKSWISQAVKAGMRAIEVCSFVPPKVIPGMEDAKEVVAHSLLQKNLEVSVLSPNFRGAENAFGSFVHKIILPVSISDSHSRANVRKSRAEMIEDFRQVCDARDQLEGEYQPLIEAGLATAFGCTIEGKISERDVLETAVACIEAGADSVILADTCGYANPKQVQRLFKLTKAEVDDALDGVHLHNTYGLGLANAFAAIEAGATRLDSSFAGLGGCPFAPGASGNIVTEDLVHMLEAQGLRTGIDIDELMHCREIIKQALPNDTLYGFVEEAGLPKGFRN